MTETNVVPLPSQIPPLPVVVADPRDVARIESEIDIKDRSGIAVFGDRAQQEVSSFADRILTE